MREYRKTWQRLYSDCINKTSRNFSREYGSIKGRQVASSPLTLDKCARKSISANYNNIQRSIIVAKFIQNNENVNYFKIHLLKNNLLQVG